MVVWLQRVAKAVCDTLEKMVRRVEREECVNQSRLWRAKQVAIATMIVLLLVLVVLGLVLRQQQQQRSGVAAATIGAVGSMPQGHAP